MITKGSEKLLAVTGTTNFCPCCSGTQPGHMGYDPAYLDVHSCSHECKRPLCVAQRTIEALAPYVQHLPSCEINGPDWRAECSCGLAGLRGEQT